MNKILALSACAAILAAAAGHAAATEYVVNGGFETGDFTGWSPAGNVSTPYNFVDRGGAYDGSFKASMGNFVSQGEGGVSQTLGTAAGGVYDISLWWRDTADNAAANQNLQVLWNGVVVTQALGLSNANYVEITAQVTGLGSDTLTIQGVSESGYNLVDDVSVVGGGRSVGGVPEPASWAMMICGFFGLGAALRRRREAPAAA